MTREISPFEIFQMRGRSSVAGCRSVVNFTMMVSYTPLRYVRNVANLTSRRAVKYTLTTLGVIINSKYAAAVARQVARACVIAMSRTATANRRHSLHCRRVEIWDYCNATSRSM